MGDRGHALKNVFTYRNLVHAIAGATGSSVAMTVFFPLDTVRTRLQVEDKCPKKVKFSPEIIAEILEEEGLSGVYNGWWPVVTSVCVSNFVYFYVFNGLKAVFYGKGAKPYPAKDLLLAFIAGVVNVLTTTPLWVANTRLKLQGIQQHADKPRAKHSNGGNNNSRDAQVKGERPPQKYNGLRDCIMQIQRYEGLVALWSGVAPSVLLATNPAVQFMFYEAFKRRAQQGDKKKELSAVSYFMMGAVSKMIATFITYPLQIVQARLRAGKDKNKRGLISMLQTLSEIHRTQGRQGLYKGLEARMTQTALAAALMFLTYEKITATVFNVMRQDFKPQS